MKNAVKYLIWLFSTILAVAMAIFIAPSIENHAFDSETPENGYVSYSANEVAEDNPQPDLTNRDRDRTRPQPVPEPEPPGIGILIDGTPLTMDVAPFIQDGRTFVPFRAIGEAFGDVDWDNDTRTASIDLPNGTIISMTIGEPAITITDTNGNISTIQSDAAPIIQDGRTMLPVRGLAEAAGFEVYWDAENQNVVITT